jgi:hypothetical protein
MRATIEEAVLSVEFAPRLYKEDLTQLELEMSPVPEFHMGSQSRVQLREDK